MNFTVSQFTHRIVHTHRCLKELLDYDASITKADKEGNNALHIACIHGQLHIVQFLLQRGLSAELRCVNISISKSSPYCYLHSYSNGYLGTPLSCAAFYGHAHIVKFLLSRGVSCSGSYAELKVSSQPHINTDIRTLHLLHVIYAFTAVFDSDVPSVTGHSTRSLKCREDLVGSSKN